MAGVINRHGPAEDAVPNEEFMRLLVRHRKARGLSQTDVAGRLKVSNSAVCNWETGRNLPSSEMIPKLARILDIDPMELTKVLEPEPFTSAK